METSPFPTSVALGEKTVLTGVKPEAQRTASSFKQFFAGAFNTVATKLTSLWNKITGGTHAEPASGQINLFKMTPGDAAAMVRATFSRQTELRMTVIAPFRKAMMEMYNDVQAFDYLADVRYDTAEHFGQHVNLMVSKGMDSMSRELTAVINELTESIKVGEPAGINMLDARGMVGRLQDVSAAIAAHQFR